MADPTRTGVLRTTLMVVLLGTALTGYVAWLAHRAEARLRGEAFRELATSQVAKVNAIMENLRDTELEALARHCADTPVTPEGFRQFTGFLTRNSAIQGWEWIPAVPAGASSGFETAARKLGIAGFSIWEKDGQGHHLPAAGRPVYYPVFQVAPLAGNAAALGYDLGSEPLRREGLEMALGSGQATATRPITLVQETGSQKGMLIFRPVFGPGPDRVPRGFALAVLRIGTMMENARIRPTVRLELALAVPGEAPLPLAASAAPAGAPASLTLSQTLPAFGRSFRITAQARPEFLRQHPARAGGLVALIGAMATAGLATFTAIARSRRAELERRVAEATLELREREQSFQKMAVLADRANAAKSEFLANMSHEIRTPLNGVLGMAELLAGSDLDADQASCVAAINRSGASLLSLLNDILDFSKIEAGQLTLESVPFDLEHLVFDVAELFRTKLEGRPVELLVDFSPAAPTAVVGDPGRIRQVLNNLVSNAIKFTESGYVLVELGAEPGRGRSWTYRMVVRDTGIGIAPDIQANLFHPFVQANSSTARRFGGSGLGLVLVRRIVEAMGGEVRMESQEGAGTSLFVTLPLTPDGGARPATAGPAALAGQRVLVIDDLALNRRLLSRQLEAYGIHATAAPSGEDALERIEAALGRDEPFAVALVDLGMPPGMDGAEFGRRVRSDPRCQAMALVVLTSSGLRGEPQQLAALGFDGYLLKPVGAESLVRALGAAMAHAAGRQPGGLVTRHSVAPDCRDRAAKITAKFQGRILLVEDQEVNQLVARRFLEALGTTVELAADGRVAVDKIGEDRFDLVMMDCQMPEMDGFEATRRIRAGEAGTGRHVPIVAMTAHAMAEDRARCMAAGMDDYLTKPVTRAALAPCLERWLAKTLSQ